MIGLGIELASYNYTGSWNWPKWNWGNSQPAVHAETNYYAWNCTQLQNKINQDMNTGDNSIYSAPGSYYFDEAMALQHIYEEKGCHP